MTEKKPFRIFKLSRNKITIFIILFLFVSLVPVISSDRIPFGFGRAQPAVIYLLYLVRQIDERTHYGTPTSILYGISFVTAYSILYMVSAVAGDALDKISEKRKDKKKKGGNSA